MAEAKLVSTTKLNLPTLGLIHDTLGKSAPDPWISNHLMGRLYDQSHFPRTAKNRWTQETDIKFQYRATGTELQKMPYTCTVCSKSVQFCIIF